MAGMVDFFAAVPNIGWWRLRDRFASAFHTECLRIDGLMGQYYVGADEYWVDYDDGILY